MSPAGGPASREWAARRARTRHPVPRPPVGQGVAVMRPGGGPAPREGGAGRARPRHTLTRTGYQVPGGAMNSFTVSGIVAGLIVGFFVGRKWSEVWRGADDA